MKEIVIKRKADGTRYVRPYLGRAKDGRALRPYHEFPASMSDEEVERAARVWVEETLPGYLAGGSHYVGDLLGAYIRHLEQGGRPSNTIRSYRTLARHCVSIARKPAKDVSVLDIEVMYESLMKPKDMGGAGLGGRTVIQLHWLLSGAFGWMMHLGIVDTNPLRDVEKPEKGRFEARVFEGEDFEKVRAMLLDAMQSDPRDEDCALRREVAFGAWIALYTGMRSGEVCALRRTDYRPTLKDLRVCGTVTEPRGGPVRQPTTKGKRSRSVAVSGEVAEALARHEASYRAAGVARGPKSPIVSVDGASLMRPSVLSSGFGAMCRDAGLKGYKFHSLRHTHATQLLAAGVDMKTVSERLGHADVKTTLETYAHVLPGRDAFAADVFSQVADGGARW